MIIEKQISTGLMQPGEEKTLRMEWDSPIDGDYIPQVFGSVLIGTWYDSDAQGMTIRLDACSLIEPEEHTLTCRAFTGAWVEAH
jgi:hypothetical protein